EGHFVGIHVVVAAVVEGDFDIHHLVASEHTAFHGFANALVHRLDEFFGNGAANNVVDELVAFARLVGLDANLGVAVLAASTGLADVLALRLALPADRLPTGHVPGAHACRDRGP